MKARMDRPDTFLTSLTMYIKPPEELLTAIFHAYLAVFILFFL